MSNATTVEGALVSLLLNNSGVTTLVGSRIAPITDPQNIARPKITYQRLRTDRSSESGGFTNSGPTGYACAYIQIDCWSDSLLTAKQTISAVRKCLNGVSGTVAGFSIGAIVVIDEKELPATIYEGQGKPIQHVICELKVSYGDN